MLEWIIADRRFRLLIDKESIPDSWETAFTSHVRAVESADSPVHVEIDATPMCLESNMCSTRLERDTNSACTRLFVDVPDSRGSLILNNNLCRGRFDVGADGIFGLFVTLRIALALVMEETDGLLLHASGVWREGKVYLFCGPSGAGKTTIAVDLRENGKNFSEDEIALEFDSAGQLIAHSTPFGETRTQRDCPDSAPVAGICFISQSKRTKLSRSDTQHAVEMLLRESRWFVRDLTTTQLVLNVIGRIVEKGLCYNLEFSKDTTFWSLLDEAEKQNEPS